MLAQAIIARDGPGVRRNLSESVEQMFKRVRTLELRSRNAGSTDFTMEKRYPIIPVSRLRNRSIAAVVRCSIP